MDFLFFLLLPFVQIGTSYYASIGTLLAALTVARLRRPIAVAIESYWPVVASMVFMAPSLLTGGSADPMQDLLRVSREGLVAGLLILILAGARLAPIKLNPRRTMAFSIAALMLLLALTSVQYVGLARGVYLGLPADWYSQGEGTIATDLSLRYSQLRPSATFSEPSYLSFVVLSLVFMLLPARGMKRSFVMLLALAFAIGVLCQAASFVLFAVLIGATNIYDRVPPKRRLVFLPIALILLIFLVLVGSQIDPIARVLNGGSVSGDRSIFVRVVGPMQVLPQFLLEHPVGMPFASLLQTLAAYTRPLGLPAEEYVHNSVFNLFFEFGFLGIVPLVALFWAPDNTARAYLLSCMLFNGAFLALDKLAVVGFAMGIYGALRRREWQQAGRRQHAPNVPTGATFVSSRAQSPAPQ